MKATAMKMPLVCLAALLVYGCGTSDGTGVQQPAPPPHGPVTFAQVAVVIQANCAKCHDGTNQPAFTEANFKASKAKDELTSGGMPLPPNTISAADKAVLLTYLGS